MTQDFGRFFANLFYGICCGIEASIKECVLFHCVEIFSPNRLFVSLRRIFKAGFGRGSFAVVFPAAKSLHPLSALQEDCEYS